MATAGDPTGIPPPATTNTEARRRSSQKNPSTSSFPDHDAIPVQRQGSPLASLGGDHPGSSKGIRRVTFSAAASQRPPSRRVLSASRRSGVSRSRSSTRGSISFARSLEVNHAETMAEVAALYSKYGAILRGSLAPMDDFVNMNIQNLCAESLLYRYVLSEACDMADQIDTTIKALNSGVLLTLGALDDLPMKRLSEQLMGNLGRWIQALEIGVKYPGALLPINKSIGYIGTTKMKGDTVNKILGRQLRRAMPMTTIDFLVRLVADDTVTWEQDADEMETPEVSKVSLSNSKVSISENNLGGESWPNMSATDGATQGANGDAKKEEENGTQPEKLPFPPVDISEVLRITDIYDTMPKKNNGGFIGRQFNSRAKWKAWSDHTRKVKELGIRLRDVLKKQGRRVRNLQKTRGPGPNLSRLMDDLAFAFRSQMDGEKVVDFVDDVFAVHTDQDSHLHVQTVVRQIPLLKVHAKTLQQAKSLPSFSERELQDLFEELSKLELALDVPGFRELQSLLSELWGLYDATFPMCTSMINIGYVGKQFYQISTYFGFIKTITYKMREYSLLDLVEDLNSFISQIQVIFYQRRPVELPSSHLSCYTLLIVPSALFDF